MTIESQTDSQLVLRQPRPPYARTDAWPYIVAIVLVLLFAIFSTRAWFEKSVSHDVVLYAAGTEMLICLAFVYFGLWLDWRHAEVVCRIDKSERVITVERITPRFHRTIQYALDELQKVDLLCTDNPGAPTTYAIRFRFGGTRTILLRRSRRQHEQDLALTAIRQFVKSADGPTQTAASG